ncbi:hypothetical protein [Amycolatopsis sp. RTGN1]|uniref:hypothetical protein n=1 Tax=Amycolatopsis ponsaeliensis TaxID=2992142 RepID=UPI00254EE1B0|nr:hypothetical protein [Amycolatopsis sp. RTGN1]
MATREERIIGAVLDLTSDLAESWGLATYVRNYGYMTSLYGRMVLLGPSGDALRIDPVRNRRPWAYTIQPVLPYDEDEFATGWVEPAGYVHHPRLKYPPGWFMPRDYRPRPLVVETRTPIKEVADRLEEDVLPTYRYWADRIRARNARRRERLAQERATALDLAQQFGGPVRLVPGLPSVTSCRLDDGQSRIQLDTRSPYVEMSFFVPCDRAAAITPQLARLLGFASTTTT